MKRDYSTLDRINIDANESIEYVSDQEQFGVLDYWEDAGKSGREDCDGYVVTKLRRLIALGWPTDALRIKIVGVEKPGDHAVLCAKDDDGKWWVLDNRYPHPMRPSMLPYTWQQWGIGREWCEVSWQ